MQLNGHLTLEVKVLPLAPESKHGWEPTGRQVEEESCSMLSGRNSLSPPSKLTPSLLWRIPLQILH